MSHGPPSALLPGRLESDPTCCAWCSVSLAKARHAPLPRTAKLVVNRPWTNRAYRLRFCGHGVAPANSRSPPALCATPHVAFPPDSAITECTPGHARLEYWRCRPSAESARSRFRKLRYHSSKLSLNWFGRLVQSFLIVVGGGRFAQRLAAN